MRSFFGSKVPKKSRRLASRSTSIEPLEERTLLTTFTVLNLSDGGAGSLRQSILNANTSAGADTIDFNVAGTITLSSALPAVTGQVNIDGTSAPAYAGTPLVTVDFNSAVTGLVFAAGSSGSALRGLAIVDATGSGVTLNGAGNMLVVGNYIGLRADGTTAAGNGGSGIDLIKSSNDVIGGEDGEDGNVISANGKDGIRLTGSSSNEIVNNIIGADATGMLALGNLANGIEITACSNNNLIGGDATGGNDPTNHVFVRPPDGNLISGNLANGVLITNGATGNQLSGNFIGTTADGNCALGNTLDGVDIVKANCNALIGCTIEDDPFVYYNVISGNGANGLEVSNSNDTTIQANFFGMGANNCTPVGNNLNGVVVEGTSTRTTMGGPIPLGNVDAANGLNGIVVQDKASFFTSYNTFCGLAAFSDNPTLGNGADGMLITSTGGNILIRTNVITENGCNGIEIAGAATGVRVSGNIIGLNTDGLIPMGNVGNGVEVGGTAHNIVIGGPQLTFNIIPENAISANGENGVAIVDKAHNVTVNNSFIGINVTGHHERGNHDDGVYIGAGTYSNTIGSPDPSLLTVISGNHGNGIDMQGTRNNTVVGTVIGADPSGLCDMGNCGDGILVNNSSGNMIGRVSVGSPAGAANLIAYNNLDGVFIESGSGNSVRENSIYCNGSLGIELASGANKNQQSPVLTGVQNNPLNVQVCGTLDGKAKTVFTIEFYANDAADPSGRIFLGSEKVKTNAAGVANFTFYGPLRPSGSNFVTATATDSSGNTSEFSNAIC